MLAVCTDYDTGRTQYSAADELRWQEYQRKLASVPNTTKPIRKDMAILWLRPLKGLAPVDYRRLCIKASTPRDRGWQRLFFAGYTRGRGETKASLREHTSRLKERYAVRNALRYLSIKANTQQYSWREFLQYPMSETMANPATVQFFARHCSTDFIKRWSMPQGKGPMAMKSWESLIPAVISKHYEAVTAYGLGFEGHTWRGQNQQSWRLSRPSHNLSGNGRAATSRDTDMTNRDLGASPRSDERLRAGQARQSHWSHDVTCKLTWSCESRRRT